MLAMGASQPWPEALEVLTGEREMDATAILEYFAPLQKWLDEQNKGQPVGLVGPVRGRFGTEEGRIEGRPAKSMV